jgi:hypothetical protein
MDIVRIQPAGPGFSDVTLRVPNHEAQPVSEPGRFLSSPSGITLGQLLELRQVVIELGELSENDVKIEQLVDRLQEITGKNPFVKQEFQVTFSVDVDAVSPREAVLAARDLMRDAGFRFQFTVTSVPVIVELEGVRKVHETGHSPE